jgi:hypothetical protein
VKEFLLIVTVDKNAWPASVMSIRPVDAGANIRAEAVRVLANVKREGGQEYTPDSHDYYAGRVVVESGVPEVTDYYDLSANDLAELREG